MEASFVFMLIYYVVCYGFAIAAYVLRALGMYNIAKRRGIEHPWMAWVPIVNFYLLGSISDQYQYVVKGRNKAKRKWLLGLYITMMVVTVLIVVITLVMVIGGVSSAYNGAEEGAIVGMVLGSSLGILLMAFAISGVSIAMMIIYFLAEYDLYRSCDPDNSTVFIVLTILLGVVEPFFVFACRNKDFGMPPRKTNVPMGYIPQQPAAEPVWQAPAEPAQQPVEGPVAQPEEESVQPAEEAVQQPVEAPAWQPDATPVEESSWQPAEEIAWQPPAEDLFTQPQQEEAEPWNPSDSE